MSNTNGPTGQATIEFARKSTSMEQSALNWSGDYYVPATFGSDKFESQIDIGSTSVFGVEIV